MVSVVEAVTVLAIAGTVGVLVVRWFVRLEREGRQEVSLFIVVATMVVEAILFQAQADTPVGLFRPGPLRTWELLLLCALIARAIVHGIPKQITATGAALLAFMMWYASSALIGLLTGNPTDLIQFQAKLALYLGGGYVLARGVATDRLVTSRGVGRALVVLGLVTVWMVTMSMNQTSITFPALAVPYLGPIGADAATLLAAIGTTAILVAACGRARHRLIIILASLPLLIAPIASAQRASIIALGASAVVVAAAALGTTWSRRITVTPTEAILTLLALLIPVIGYLVVQWNAGRPILFRTFVEETFVSPGNQQSAEARVLLWDAGREMIAEHPFMGSGLGRQFSVRLPDTTVPFVDGAFHNIGFDLIVRSGLVGAALFGCFLLLFVRDAWKAWRGSTQSRDAALALAAVAVAAGFVAKGAVESVLEKGKLATAVGLACGVVARIATTSREIPVTATSTSPSRARDVGLHGVPRLVEPISGSVVEATPLRPARRQTAGDRQLSPVGAQPTTVSAPYAGPG